MPEVTDRNQVRAEIAAGGWVIAWGDLINEGDALDLIVHLEAETPGEWVLQQVQAQLVKFGQSLADVSDDVIAQAIAILEAVINHRFSGEWDIDGLGIKAGIATYHRWWQITFHGRVISSNKLPNNFQPYIGLRIAKPLPLKGQLAKEAIGLTPAGSVPAILDVPS